MKPFLLFFVLLLSVYAKGQLNNSFFDQRLSIEESDSSTFYAGINLLAFGKNNEYFNTTIEGYTLFGYQLNPHVTYFVNKHVRLDAGLYLQKDFGNEKFSATQPTLSLRVKHRNFNFTFGTLEGSLHHQLIEPLYDFERVLKNRMENGIQFQWMKEGLFSDVWVNWEKMIYPNDTNQERFVAGLSLNKRLIRISQWTISLPVQGLVRHAGGQINTTNLPLTTILNTATGLTAERQSTTWIEAMGVKAYYVTYSNHTSRVLPYKKGTGIFINPFMQTKWGITLMGTYWRSDRYLTFDGGQLYPVTTESMPVVFQNPREFYMVRLMYDLKMADGLLLTVRAEPFWDTYSKSIQYSYGFYLNFTDRFFIGHAKKK